MRAPDPRRGSTAPPGRGKHRGPHGQIFLRPPVRPMRSVNPERQRRAEVRVAVAPMTSPTRSRRDSTAGGQALSRRIHQRALARHASDQLEFSMNTTRSTAQGHPPRLGHARRGAAGGHNDPQALLDRLPIGHHDYKRVVGALLRLHNHAHAKKHKGVSFQTMLVRQRFLVSFFADLRANTLYRNLDPRALATRHIEAMVALWLERGLLTATVHNYLSILRTFGAWIGKAGLVRCPAYYVGEASPLAHRTQNATFDHGW